MIKVYIVTQGDYSDKHNVAVFTSQALADECVERGGGDSVEEYELDRTMALSGLSYWEVSMSRDGNEAYAESIGPLPERATNGSTDHPSLSNKMYWFYILASDREHAVKIAAERHAQVIAEGRWLA